MAPLRGINSLSIEFKLKSYDARIASFNLVNGAKTATERHTLQEVFDNQSISTVQMCTSSSFWSRWLQKQQKTGLTSARRRMHAAAQVTRLTDRAFLLGLVQHCCTFALHLSRKQANECQCVYSY
jgi:hypothetical protein